MSARWSRLFFVQAEGRTWRGLRISVSKGNGPKRDQRRESLVFANIAPSFEFPPQYAQSRHVHELTVFALWPLFAGRKVGQFSVRPNLAIAMRIARPSARRDFRKFPRAGPRERTEFTVLLYPRVYNHANLFRLHARYVRSCRGEKHPPPDPSLCPRDDQSSAFIFTPAHPQERRKIGCRSNVRLIGRIPQPLGPRMPDTNNIPDHYSICCEPMLGDLPSQGRCDRSAKPGPFRNRDSSGGVVFAKLVQFILIFRLRWISDCATAPCAPAGAHI